MLVSDLRDDITSMPHGEALSLIMSIRKSRQTSKKRRQTQKKTTLVLSELASTMSKDQLKELLSNLEGRSDES